MMTRVAEGKGRPLLFGELWVVTEAMGVKIQRLQIKNPMETGCLTGCWSANLGIYCQVMEFIVFFKNWC